jgi:hypothetical protein
MDATCLTLPSCALTWARSAVLTNLACSLHYQHPRNLRLLQAARAEQTAQLAMQEDAP